MKVDKKYHILAGFLVAALVALPAYLESGNLFAGLWPSLTATAIASRPFPDKAIDNIICGIMCDLTIL